jgi:hypothetical protein
MKRKTLLVITGLLLSFALIAIEVWVKSRTLPYYLYEKETSHLNFQEWNTGSGYAYLVKYGGDLPALTWQAFWWEKLLFNTFIILLVGSFISVYMPNKPTESGKLTLISLIPFFLYSLVQPNQYFLFIGLIFWIPYVFLALKTPYLIGRFQN